MWGGPQALAGGPFSVKNLFDVEGAITPAGAKITETDSPLVACATLLARLVSAGAVLPGALNMGELAYDFTGENIQDGACRNPWDTDRVSAARLPALAQRWRLAWFPLR
ncbi:MAG: Asp-tRNA(Asn)/Glu-tRNA(Gln) amidotransferase A subunit family amidase [Candidatus Azotimanducaceae bacterium]|jgi:Asp-tRNA(Asn)/Glu-tRNA(Gln) amidotransferase A subunit family amidase